MPISQFIIVLVTVLYSLREIRQIEWERKTNYYSCVILLYKLSRNFCYKYQLLEKKKLFSSYLFLPTLFNRKVGTKIWASKKFFELINPYPTAFPYGNGMVLHFYQQQESSTTKTVHKIINKGLKTYVYSLQTGENFH